MLHIPGHLRRFLLSPRLAAGHSFQHLCAARCVKTAGYFTAALFFFGSMVRPIGGNVG